MPPLSTERMARPFLKIINPFDRRKDTFNYKTGQSNKLPSPKILLIFISVICSNSN